jgi:hypothetical protein
MKEQSYEARKRGRKWKVESRKEREIDSEQQRRQITFKV